jgi:hypothetical protein
MWTCSLLGRERGCSSRGRSTRWGRSENQALGLADAVREERGTRCEIRPLFCSGPARPIRLRMSCVPTGEDGISGFRRDAGFGGALGSLMGDTEPSFVLGTKRGARCGAGGLGFRRPSKRNGTSASSKWEDMAFRWRPGSSTLPKVPNSPEQACSAAACCCLRPASL